MLEKAQRRRPDLLLLLSLLFVILVHPALDTNDLGRIVLGVVMFVSIIMATIRLAELKGRLWPTRLLMLAILVVLVAKNILRNQVFDGIEWGLLVVFFALTVVRLFSYLKNAETVDETHLYTAVSIYLLLGLLWFSLYSAIDIFFPGAIIDNNSVQTSHQTGILYFSLVTLATVGYGDVVPRYGEVRMLAALEGVAGVLYVAITVALLVGAYKRKSGTG